MNMSALDMGSTLKPSGLSKGIKVRVIIEVIGVGIGGDYDYSDERDRWQMLSKELQLKQEVLHRVMKDIKDKSD